MMSQGRRSRSSEAEGGEPAGWTVSRQRSTVKKSDAPRLFAETARKGFEVAREIGKGQSSFRKRVGLTGHFSGFKPQEMPQESAGRIPPAAIAKETYSTRNI